MLIVSGLQRHIHLQNLGVHVSDVQMYSICICEYRYITYIYILYIYIYMRCVVTSIYSHLYRHIYRYKCCKYNSASEVCFYHFCFVWACGYKPNSSLQPLPILTGPFSLPNCRNSPQGVFGELLLQNHIYSDIAAVWIRCDFCKWCDACKIQN